MTIWDFAHHHTALAVFFALLAAAVHADAHKHPGNIEAAKKLESMATKTGQHDGYGLEKHAMWCRIGLEEARDVEPSDGRSS